MCLHAIHSMRCQLLQGVVCEMTRYSARQALLWQLTPHIIYSSELIVSEMTAIAPSVKHLHLVSMKQE